MRKSHWDWRSGIPLSVVEIAVFLILLLAIAQPALLRAFHVHQGEDLTVADVISVLTTVVSIIAATSGVLVYQLAKNTLEASNKSFVDQAVLKSATQSTDLVLNQLEPLLTTAFDDPPMPEDELQRSLCSLCIELARSASATAQGCLDRSGKDFAEAERAKFQNAVWINSAYVKACDVLVRGASASDQAAVDALAFLSKVEGVIDRETKAWVLLCCHPESSPEWREAKILARQAVNLNDAVMRRRYETHFGDDFFS